VLQYLFKTVSLDSSRRSARGLPSRKEQLVTTTETAPVTALPSASYFDDFAHLAMERDEAGVLVVTMNDGAGGPITFSALDHTEFTEAFYRIGDDARQGLAPVRRFVDQPDGP
jgi:predicted dienelactone hydrolase